MISRRVATLAASLLALLLGAAPPGTAGPTPSPPLVFAAASLTDVLQQVAADYAGGRPGAVRLSFGSTATLARQIESGAPAELFFSADQDWMEYVVQRGLVRPESRVDLLGNSLVLIAPSSSQSRSLSLSRASIGAALGTAGRVALADPASVPAGKYAKAAMTRLGLWKAIESRAVWADNVRTALQFVARGEAALGVVYETDARAEPRVRVVARLPADSHPPIVYPLALTVRASPAAEALYRHLTGSAARARFESAGFRVLPRVTTRFADDPRTSVERTADPYTIPPADGSSASSTTRGDDHDPAHGNHRQHRRSDGERAARQGRALSSARAGPWQGRTVGGTGHRTGTG